MQYTCEHSVGEKFYKFVNGKIEVYEISSCEFGYNSNWYTVTRSNTYGAEKKMATDNTLKSDYLTHRQLLDTLLQFWASLERVTIAPDTLKAVDDLLRWDDI